MKQPNLGPWLAYFDALSGDELWEEAKAANRYIFVQGLLEEGLRAPEITTLFTHVAHKLAAERLLPPSGGYYDLQHLMTISAEPQ